MRLVTYASADGDRVGVIDGDLIHALPRGTTLIELLGPSLRQAGERALAEPDEIVALADVTLRAPIPRPPSIRDCLCFLDHMRGCLRASGGTGTLEATWYQIPAFYFANPATVIGPHDDVPISPGSAWFDFELEIGAVIGAPGRDLTPEQAIEHIAGYTLLCDWSARDLQGLESQLKIGQAKGKDGATTLGPWLVTPDELPFGPDGGLALQVRAEVNGRPVGEGRTDAMDWSFGEVVSYASRGVELRPGDVFGSGTVPGCCLIEHLDFGDLGAFRGWLKDGDVVSLRAEGLGEVRQTVRASAAPHPLAARPDPTAKPRRPRVNPAKPALPYTKGLHQVADGVWAWLLPDGGYGRSNAGLVAGEGASLLVDTLYDLPLTAEMLSGMEPITDRHPIGHAVLTHANGDHTHGGQLLAGSVRVVAAEGTAHEMHTEMAPELTTALQIMDLGPTLTPYLRERFGPFDFGGIRLRTPDQTFDRRLTLDVGGREVRLLNLGPAHTEADTVVHVPDAGVLFAGDLLFIGGTPIVWSGPIANWIAACDTMLALDAPTVVPGHGPVTDPDGIRAVRGYLSHVVEQADAAHAKGMDFQEAAFGIDLAEYGDWLDAERVVVNVYRRYREIHPDQPALDQLALFGLMAEWDSRRQP
ncbi:MULTISPECIES: fumarylacetoacetate hydrolase family protein [Streptosporangium]|uniref:2-keto-4-pentenoate hydratase/2-oxohepta-3-ene-1,7-dioic acid hydratase in catechol pathway/glyoxylase-like metal-dependent hydrolase (Beta-lactamase superfamily II) n=1 Tax=Streptosporangium brasiliense TaxID=47480 RepID=A0ABT9R6H6_9ACTN|nr:fumarylacetoacetate hydrolase family protein [Streptosporangium brasiliense]MDP9864849.1 2-keto-4-pentenoate hydratase/2-oxohepta-3-ene-1,7-dioic acid hydratase in catechol pathway/glyoxylase-like metal-dependent hydrolase (beta-lactamase superfamily II) [Streptosporangium brasiliense]